MAANTQYIPITMPLGTSRAVRLNVYRADGTTPLNITGAVVVVTARENSSEVNPMFMLANDLGGGDKTQVEVLDATRGQILINIAPRNTIAHDAGQYTWACEAYWPGATSGIPDRRYTVAYGPLVLTEHA